MKTFFVIALLHSLSVAGQDSLDKERETIYQHVIQTFVDKEVFVINETFTSIYKYDIDADYQRWFYDKFPRTMAISVIPIQYEITVLNFLYSKGVNLDTGSIFRQIEYLGLDSISKYKIPVNLISFTRASLGYSFWRNLFKKRMAVGLSSILFDERKLIALVKLQVYSKRKQVAANPSKIIILQKQVGEWETLGVIPNK